MAKRLIVAAFLGIIVILLYNNALNITASPQQIATSQVAEQRRALKRLVKIAQRAVDNVHISNKLARQDSIVLTNIINELNKLGAVINHVDDSTLVNGNALTLATDKISNQLTRVKTLNHKQQVCDCRFIHKKTCTRELNKKWAGAWLTLQQVIKGIRQLQQQLNDVAN